MKRRFILLAALATLMIPVVCSAAPPHPGPYVSGFLGVSVPNTTDFMGYDYVVGKSFNERVELDPGVNVGGTYGFDFGGIRLEGELSYKSANIKTITDKSGNYRYRDADGTLGALALMFNAFFDLHNYSPVTPYLGGGTGFAAMHLSDTYVPGDPVPIYLADDDSVFAYQAGGGLEIALNRNLSLDLGYRYFATTKARFGSNSDISTDLTYRSHNAAAGLRVKF